MENEVKNKWLEILEYLKNEFSLTKVSYETWILPLKLHSVNESDNSAVIAVQDSTLGQMGVTHISNKYGLFLQNSIEEITGYHLNLSFVNSSELQSDTNDKQEAPVKENNPNINISLNEKYTFDTFIVGKNNSMAHAAALSVAESPLSSEYNPLYIYGGSGLGKTHLIHSIAHYVMEHSPNLKVLYITSEDYISEIVEAMRKSKQDRTTLNNIKRKYREVDILMIDDVQFIIGKDSSQEEFFHTFNALYEQGKQIILTSDKHPNQMEKLDERYKSRFNWGLPIDITAPDYETRLAILQDKNDNNAIKLDLPVLKYVAENIKTNIRDLEGAYNKLIFRSKLQHCEITVETAMEDIKDLILTDEKQKITIDYIINIVAEHYNVTLEEIISKKRTKDLVIARHICIYLCSKYTNSSQAEIGSKMDKDRSTISSACDSIEKRLKTDVSLQNEIDILTKIINP